MWLYGSEATRSLCCVYLSISLIYSGQVDNERSAVLDFYGSISHKRPAYSRAGNWSTSHMLRTMMLSSQKRRKRSFMNTLHRFALSCRRSCIVTGLREFFQSVWVHASVQLFCGVQSIGAGVIFGHYRVSCRCRFLRGSGQFNLNTITGALPLRCLLYCLTFSLQKKTPFNFISFCPRYQFQDIQCPVGSILDEDSERQCIFCTTMRL
jgi:hypothetical protein